MTDLDESAQAPAWFGDVLGAPSVKTDVVVQGARIHLRAWGEAGPGIVLIHGGAAHSHWWDHIAPLLATEYRVVALDLSGHGDSDRRGQYSVETWAAETMCAARAGGISGPPVVIGHSMGGWVALTTGAAQADAVAGVVAIDSAPRRPIPEDDAAARRQAFGPLRYYATAEEAIARFRVVPQDPWVQPYLARYVAQRSIVEQPQGWTWKFDPRIFDRPRMSPDLLADIQCRVAIFRAEHGLCTPDVGAQMYELLGRVAPIITLPFAGHHALLDEPIGLVVGLRTLLADWRHSHPAIRSEPTG